MNKICQKLKHNFKPRNILPTDLGKVAVLYGGNSKEREISLMSGKTVIDILTRLNVDVIPIDVKGEDWHQALSKDIDRVFNILHGPEGEDGVILGFLETKRIPYTGSSVLASAIAMDKHFTKMLWKSAGFPVAKYIVYHKGESLPTNFDFPYPFCVKPVNEGSSIDVVKVHNRNELLDVVETKSEYDSLMIEQWIEGSEYTVGILQNKALPAIRLSSPNVFYDYNAKYIDVTTQYIIPCDLNDTEEMQLLTLAESAFKHLSCSSWGRVDLMCDKAGKFYLLEVNTVPGFTHHSLIPMAAKAIGCSLEQLVLEILADTL